MQECKDAEYWADDSVLKESADGTSLIFSFGLNSASLSFDLHTLQFKQLFQNRVEDILENTVLLKIDY